MTTKNNLGFLGVMGPGRIGKIHAENLATRIPGVEVAAIARVSSEPEICAGISVPFTCASRSG